MNRLPGLVYDSNITDAPVCSILQTAVGRLSHVFLSVSVPDYRYVLLNERALQSLRSFGAENPESAIGTHPWDHIPGWREAFIPHIEEVRRTHQPLTVRNFTFRSAERTSYMDLDFLPIIDSHTGEVAYVSMMVVYITERVQAEKALKESEEQYRRIVETANEGIWMVDTEARTTYVNNRLSEMLGYAPEEILGRKSTEFVSQQNVEILEQNLKRRRQGIAESYEFSFLRKDGSTLWVIANTAPVYDDEGQVYASFAMLSDITERKRTEQLADALNGINLFISSTLDYDEIMRRSLAEGTKAIGAETGSIDMREGLCWAVRYQYGFSNSIIGDRFTDEEAPFVVLAERSRQAIAIDDTETDPRVDSEVMRRYAIVSVLIVPLIVRGQVIGGLFFNFNTRQHTFTETEIDFAAKLGSSISLALENARLYSDLAASKAETEEMLNRESRFSRLLQRALLPERPAIVEGYDIAYAYIPAYASREVGGDFYDVFRTKAGRIGILIGDVSGKGVEAASLAAATRSTVRAFAYDTSSPGESLIHANDVLITEGQGYDAFVTVMLIVLDPATGHLRYADAGHPPAAVCRADGSVEFLSGGNIPIGVLPGWKFDEMQAQVGPSETMLLYTDGITEARSGHELFGQERIACALDRIYDRNPDNVVDTLLTAARDWADGQLRDDTAVLAVRRLM